MVPEDILVNDNTVHGSYIVFTLVYLHTQLINVVYLIRSINLFNFQCTFIEWKLRGISVKLMFDSIHALYRKDIPADYVEKMWPDLVHVPHYVVPAAVPGPVVVTVHDVTQLFYPPRARPQLATLYLRVVLRSALRRARRVITVSRSSRRDLINLFGAAPERLDFALDRGGSNRL